MKIISKLLIASAVAVSFAAPAFAIDYNSDSFVLQERGAQRRAAGAGAAERVDGCLRDGTYGLG